MEPKIHVHKRKVIKSLRVLKTACNVLFSLEALGVASFAIGPLIETVSHYYLNNEFKLFLPFLIWYPFDAVDVHFWGFVYPHQLWSAWVAILSVYGPDCFFLMCCAFIHVQFISLNDDWEEIIKKDSLSLDSTARSRFKEDFVKLVDRHRQLIRCVELLEKIFSKSTLFNVLTSSVIICATGFNLLVLGDLALIAPFFSFISFGMLQIFYYCFYGDCVLRSSMAVGDAIYNCRWFYTDAVDRIYFSIVMARAQHPCKLTAHGFADINLNAFTRILSTSWSYFALLRQMYHN